MSNHRNSHDEFNSDQWYELRDFFGAGFHQDWDLHASSYEGGIKQWIIDCDGDPVLLKSALLKMKTMSEEKVERIVHKEFSSAITLRAARVTSWAEFIDLTIGYLDKLSSG